MGRFFLALLEIPISVHILSTQVIACVSLLQLTAHNAFVNVVLLRSPGATPALVLLLAPSEITPIISLCDSVLN